MAYTALSDVIVPEIFVPYVIERTAEKSKLIQSGIAVANPALDKLVTAGGTTMKMPFWQDLTGRSQLWTEGSDISVNKITAAQDVACLLLRANAWGATDMSGALAGDDPMKAIGELVSDYWARDEEQTLLFILAGVFASDSMADHILDKSSVSTGLDGKMVLDGKQLLGDAAGKLQAIAMHSYTFTSLQKQNLITTVMEVGPSGSQIEIPRYLGYNVIVDDSMPVNTVVSTEGVYTLTISTAAAVGDKIKIGADELTFVANSATPGAKEVKVGATPTAAEQAANIATWLNANSALKNDFTIADSSNTVLFTNKHDDKRSTKPSITVTQGGSGTLVATIAASTPEVAADVYTSYLFARGVIGRGEGTPVSFVPVETDRDSLGSKDVLIHRRAFVMHPYGIKWVGSSVLETPSDSELSTGSNWQRVYESKNIGIVAIKHQVA